MLQKDIQQLADLALRDRGPFEERTRELTFAPLGGRSQIVQTRRIRPAQAFGTRPHRVELEMMEPKGSLLDVGIGRELTVAQDDGLCSESSVGWIGLGEHGHHCLDRLRSPYDALQFSQEAEDRIGQGFWLPAWVE